MRNRVAQVTIPQLEFGSRWHPVAEGIGALGGQGGQVGAATGGGRKQAGSKAAVAEGTATRTGTRTAAGTVTGGKMQEQEAGTRHLKKNGMLLMPQAHRPQLRKHQHGNS